MTSEQSAPAYLPINEFELPFLSLIRVALSEDSLTAQIQAIADVHQETLGQRLSILPKGWEDDPHNLDLVKWVAATSSSRQDASIRFAEVARRYEAHNERRLAIAEHIGDKVCLSIRDNKFEGLQKATGILQRVCDQAEEEAIRGAKDRDTLRKVWRNDRGVVHFGMALEYCEEAPEKDLNVLFVAEHFRRALSQSCPRSTNDPYVDPAIQISFRYISGIQGPRFQNRGLPFY